MTTIQKTFALLLLVATLVLIYILRPILTPFLAGAILGLVPREMHSTSVRLTGTKSMAYSERPAEPHSGVANLEADPQLGPV